MALSQKEDHDAKEETPSRRDCREAAPGRRADVARAERCRCGPLDWSDRVQGRYADAIPLYERALVIREKVLGREHADVADTLTNLANVYQAQGRDAEAIPLKELRSNH
jgi:tetratricopeptide (TPR) repeat protein